MLRFKKLLVMLLVLGGSISAMAQGMQQVPTVPVDKDVRIGRLDNGLTYYIRYNNWPEKRAEFYIAQKVGSIQENDEQRGLAHFLEHMCFNGTRHFEGNEVIRYCESIGVKFGQDLNAYTSIDETVYNISNVPTTRQTAIDSCLLILSDWADGLILDPKEIDKERGVIHEEWRTRTSAQSRMFERALPVIYSGCKYGYRMPIGLMEIIDNFKPEVLRAYYEKWYRPDNQGIIVVGDVDVDYVEGKIKELFGDIKMPENPAPIVPVMVPDNNEPIVVIDKDKEQKLDLVELYFKHPATPDSLKQTVPYVISDYVSNIAIQMLNSRIAERAQKPECPFVQGYVGDGQYIFSRTCDAFNMMALPKEGKIEEAIADVFREALRAAEFGFTATEYARAKANTLSALDKMYTNRDKRYSSQFCNEYKEHFLNNEPIPSIDDYYAMMKQIIPMIPVEAVNMAMKEFVLPSDTNMVIINFNIEKEGKTYPTKEGLLAAIKNVRGEKLTPYVDNVKNEPLITKMPAKGSVKKEGKVDALGYKTLVLSNGVKVNMKHTDYKKDQIAVLASGKGGSSLFGAEDYDNIKIFDDVIEASGLGNFSNTELQKALAGKMVNCSMSLGKTRQNISGSSTPNDIETLFQIIYLYFTNINKDQESYNSLLKTLEISLKNNSLSPDAAFSDSLTETMNCHNPRFSNFKVENIKGVNYDRVLAIAKQLTANAADYTFTIVGNYDEAKLRALLEQYVASLPASKKLAKSKNVSTDAKGIVVNNFKRKMETPKATSVVYWRSDKMANTLENRVRADIAGQVLSMIYLEKIREDAGATYSVGAQGSVSCNDHGTDAGMFVYCPVKPEKSDIALKIMRDEMDAMAKTCDADMVKKVQEFMVKNFDSAVKSNGFWMNAINEYSEYGVDVYNNYKEIVNRQTPQTISAFIAELLKAGNRIEVLMLPQE